jgi:hypothetical protein
MFDRNIVTRSTCPRQCHSHRVILDCHDGSRRRSGESRQRRSFQRCHAQETSHGCERGAKGQKRVPDLQVRHAPPEPDRAPNHVNQAMLTKRPPFRIRHKKCNEARPACFQCSSTGRRCDFAPSHPPRCVLDLKSHPNLQVFIANAPLLSELQPSSLPCHMAKLTSFEGTYFDYFRLVCAAEFSFFFETPSWATFILQVAHTESSIYHAALAIGALSQYRYHPRQSRSDPGNPGSVLEYSMGQYNLAIQGLNRRLENSVESAELAILASILFFNFEFLQGTHNTEGLPMLMGVHLQGAFAILHGLKALSQHTYYLENALCRLREQLSVWDVFIESNPG